MGVIDWIRNAVRITETRTPAQPDGFVPQGYTGIGPFSSGQSSSLVANQCINLIVGQLAPCRRTVVRDGQEIEHDVNALLADPWPQVAGIVFWQVYIRALLVNGNTYAIVRRDRRNVRPITMVPATEGGVTYDSNGNLVYTLTPINQPYTPTPRDLMIRLPSNRVAVANWYGFDGLTSPPPLRGAMAVALQYRIQQIVQQQAARAFESGPFFGFMAQALEQMRSGAKLDKALAETREELDKLQKNMRIPVLPPGMTPMAVPAFSMGDLNAIDALRWTVEDICRVYGVAPARLGQLSGGGAGVRTQALQDQLTDFEATAIRPVAAMIDGGLTRALLTPEERFDGLAVKTETWPIGLGSMEDRANIADQLVARAPIMTPNEARNQLFGMPPIEGGDDLRESKGAAPTNDGGPPSNDDSDGGDEG